LHVGRLSFEKRIDVILDAMALVVKNYPEATLTIIGKGPAMESLEAQSTRLNLKNNVKFKGFVKRDRLPEIYREHDVFVTASEMETQGIVLLEALASGLPVIGVNMLATPDVVHNKKTGFLVKKGDSKKMGKRMIQLIQKPKLVKEMGVNARKEARKHDIRKVMQNLEKVYIKFQNLPN
jgi:glycosyltransferase involved in cell wall biosynthesis